MVDDPYILDTWYAAARSEEVGDTPLARTLLDMALVLYRTASGEAVALLDRCPHRFAPLSLGTVQGDTLACPYHGLVFAADGHCVHAPGQPRVPAQARIRSFPVRERYGLVFVWPGDPASADADQLVDIPQYGRTGWGLSRGYTLFEARLDTITDNLIDPAHTSFVHVRTIGNRAGEDVAVTAQMVDEDTVVCGRWVDDAPAVPIVQRYTALQGPVDRWQFYHLRAPATSWVDFGSQPAGRAHTAEEQDRAPYRVLSYAFLAPCTRRSTHYFSLQLRNFAADDPAVTAEFEQLYRATFDEDRVLLEAIQHAEEHEPGLSPVLLATDAGVVRLRRRNAQLRAAQARAASKLAGGAGGPVPGTTDMEAA